MKRGWMALLALVAVANLVPLLLVMSDRSGGPRQTLLLSHRELILGYTQDENSGVTLTWSWAVPPQLDSVSAERVAALGLHCDRSALECGYGKGRTGYIAVTIRSDRWNAAIDSLHKQIDSLRAAGLADTVLQRELRYRTDRVRQLTLFTSRLEMDGIGADPAALAAGWNDGKHLILAARIHASRDNWPRDTLPGQHPTYRVNADPLPMSLYLENQWAGAVRDRSTTLSREQMYDVVVAVGQRWLPRVLRVDRRSIPIEAVAE